MTNFKGTAEHGRAAQGRAWTGLATSSGRKPRQFQRLGVACKGAARRGLAWLHHRLFGADSLYGLGVARLGEARQGWVGHGYIIAPSGATVYLN